MTGDESLLSPFSHKNGGFVSYGDNNKGMILDIGIVGKSLNRMNGEVFLVERLEHNLLCMSQLCEKGNSVTFDSSRFMDIKSK